jgi:hypothetical protein
MQHAYLQAMELSQAASPDTGWVLQIVTLGSKPDATSDTGAQLCAATALYLKGHSYGEYVFDWAWADAYQRHGLRYFPKALVAVPFTPVPGSRLLAVNEAARLALAETLIALAQSQDLSSLHLLFGDEADLQACAQAGLMLRPDDRDSVKQAVSYWLVELGELDATFRKSDIAQLKAFITRDRDTLRRAYAKLESHYARRTVFFASVNPRQFLHDPTGNRRYWTISCSAIDHDHGLDMQQVWAEVYATLYQAGEGWFLTQDELQALNSHNKDHEVLDPIRERILTRFDWDAPDVLWRWMTATDIMLDIGFDRPNRADVTQCGQIVAELNGNRTKKSNGKRLSRVPPRVNS